MSSHDLVDDAVQSLRLTTEEMDSLMWLRNREEILEYLLVKALYYTDYAVRTEDGLFQTTNVAEALSKSLEWKSPVLYRHLNRFNGGRSEWTELL